MSIFNALYPQGNFLDIRANAPTSTDYNIQVMEDLIRNLPGGGIRDLLAPVTAATLSLPYDAIQAATRTTEDDISKAMETAGMYGPKDIASEAYGLAFGRERPLSSAIERTIGASGPLAERISNLDLIGNFGFGTPAAASEVSIEEPSATSDMGYVGTSGTADDFFGTSTPTEISIPEAPKILSPTQKFNFLSSAYEDETLGEKKPSFFERVLENVSSGIGSLRDVYSKLPTPMNLIRGFAERIGEPSRYSRFGPGGTFRGGIYNIGGVNTPIQLVNDFYDRTTGLNRFDRAAQRFARTGKTSDLFASSRTLADFVRKKREVDAAKKASAAVSSTPTGGAEGRGPSGMSSALGGVYGGGAGGLHSDY